MELSEKIKTLRKQHKLTQADLAKRLGTAPTTISAWENNLNKPLMDKITVMADLFDVPTYYFFDKMDVSTGDGIVLLPIYGNISCGNGNVLFESSNEFMETPKKWTTGGDYFVLIAKGDSMIGANIKQGDELLIRKQNGVENGEIAAVVIDDKIVLKRAYRNNDSFTLVSENPSYPPIRFNPDTDNNIRIIGKLRKAITSF